MRSSAGVMAACFFGACVFVVGCGDDSGGEGGAGGHSSSTDASGAGGDDAATTGTTTGSTTSTAATGAGGGDVAPAAPSLDDVMAMHGALHLYWSGTEDCDEVEGERSTPDEDFAVFFTVPGTVDNEADDEATDPATEYTYRLRCKVGEAYSDYSNELSASPE